MTHTFTVRHRMNGTRIEATDAANAVHKFCQIHRYAAPILPLRRENPTRVFTHNGQADYVASQWSVEIPGVGRVYVFD